MAALVDSLSHDEVGLQLLNLSDNVSAELIVQAGAFAEHSFLSLNGQALPGEPKHFSVRLPPNGRLRCVAGLRRCVNDPTYAFPWHRGGVIPVPFQ